MRNVIGFVVVVSAAVLLGAHFEVTKTLAESAESIAGALPQPRILLAEASSTFPELQESTTTLPLSAEALDTGQVTTTPKVVAPAAARKAPAPEPTQRTAFKAEVVQKRATLGTSEQYPVRLIIPSIDLDAPIQAVGVNEKGEMAVPDGSSNDIGWYKGGPMPGSQGSAVLDAHVFAALKDLRHVKVGDPVYVLTKGGTRLRFVVKESTVFTLSEITPDILFGRKGSAWLNIITCAGAYIPSLGTYDHRLVDFALFEGEELN